MNEDTKNMIGFAAIAGLLILAYQVFVLGPNAKLAAAQRAQKTQTAAASAPATPGARPAAPAAPSAERPTLNRPQALALSPRVTVDTPSLAGSIDLRGARFDDLFLKGYHEEDSKTSPLVELLRPEGMTDAYFAESGWVGPTPADAPSPTTLWTRASGGTLSPGHPVTLTWRAPNGLVFTRVISVDDKFMFTIAETVSNPTGASVTLAPYVSVQRQGLPPGLGKVNIVHEGAIGILGEDKPELREAGYKSWKKKGEEDWRAKGGWFGITDKYWMTAFVPPQSQQIDARARVVADPTTGIDIYETTYSGQAVQIAPGQQTTQVSHLFAGAKTVPVLRGYQQSLHIPRFVDAVDWGNLWFLTKPVFALLEFFHRLVGNFGVAILMLTVVIRVVTFPLANKGYEMGVKMKRIQPELQEIQKRLKDDPQTLQKEMMTLYQREKVNPVSGCVPMLFQIPVFYCLTKIFTVTIEMRHAPFFGWIHDLSARDPTTIFNLFGLIPWDPSAAPLIGSVLGGMLHVGVWPLAYGLSIWLSQSMTPMTGVDPTQRAMMKFMPLMFTFIMAQYSVGLLIYWTWSSFITIIQQYIMMRRFKVENPIDDFLRRFSRAGAS
ncbi:MAG TPA: membrane protein insertase YidC [Caulobacteraceae bacterium]|jgi:YidC/Oxa1 family membrane protein insertase|nr:membrane protein insertase YidC [Caulobacteraceae bacterium]